MIPHTLLRRQTPINNIFKVKRTAIIQTYALVVQRQRHGSIYSTKINASQLTVIVEGFTKDESEIMNSLCDEQQASNTSLNDS